jgi:hypothetical protein
LLFTSARMVELMFSPVYWHMTTMGTRFHGVLK